MTDIKADAQKVEATVSADASKVKTFLKTYGLAVLALAVGIAIGHFV